MQVDASDNGGNEEVEVTTSLITSNTGAGNPGDDDGSSTDDDGCGGGNNYRSGRNNDGEGDRGGRTGRRSGRTDTSIKMGLAETVGMVVSPTADSRNIDGTACRRHNKG